MVKWILPIALVYTCLCNTISFSKDYDLTDGFELRKKSRAQKQVLSLKGNPYGLWNSEDEIIIDNNMKWFVSFTGDWFEEETVHTGRYEMNFRYCPEGRRGVFEYTPYFIKEGTYDVFSRHPASDEYSRKVPFFIKHGNGSDNGFVNQQQNGGKWLKIGQYYFEKGRGSQISIVADRSNGTVVADAVRFVYVPK
jgi:hypothetical protein